LIAGTMEPGSAAIVVFTMPVSRRRWSGRAGVLSMRLLSSLRQGYVRPSGASTTRHVALQHDRRTEFFQIASFSGGIEKAIVAFGLPAWLAF